MGTPWEGDGFFGNGSLVRSRLIMPAAWSDVVRLMLLHKYGHFWMDTDVVLYRGEHAVRMRVALSVCMQHVSVLGILVPPKLRRYNQCSNCVGLAFLKRSSLGLLPLLTDFCICIKFMA